MLNGIHRSCLSTQFRDSDHRSAPESSTLPHQRCCAGAATQGRWCNTNHAHQQLYPASIAYLRTRNYKNCTSQHAWMTINAHLPVLTYRAGQPRCPVSVVYNPSKHASTNVSHKRHWITGRTSRYQQPKSQQAPRHANNSTRKPLSTAWT